MIDRRPRSFNAEQRAILRDLALMVENEINHVNLADLHARLIESQKQEQQAKVGLLRANVGSWIADAKLNGRSCRSMLGSK